MKQVEVERIANLPTPGMLSHYEADRRVPSPNVLTRLVAALGTSPERLQGDAGRRPGSLERWETGGFLGKPLLLLITLHMGRPWKLICVASSRNIRAVTMIWQSSWASKEFNGLFILSGTIFVACV